MRPWRQFGSGSESLQMPRPRCGDSWTEGIYMGFLHARLSMALERVGNKEQVRKYRELAIRNFQHRKEWDAKTQSAQPLGQKSTENGIKRTQATLSILLSGCLLSKVAPR